MIETSTFHLVELVDSYLASSFCTLLHTTSIEFSSVSDPQTCLYPPKSSLTVSCPHLCTLALEQSRRHLQNVPNQFFASRTQHKIFGHIPTVYVVPGFSSFFQDLIILKRDFWHWACIFSSTAFNQWFSSNCSRNAFTIVAINFEKYVIHNVVCILRVPKLPVHALKNIPPKFFKFSNCCEETRCYPNILTRFRHTSPFYKISNWFFVALHHHMKTSTKWHQFLYVPTWTHRVSFQVLWHKEWSSAGNSDQPERFIIIKKFFQQILINGLQTVHQPICETMDRSITIFGSKVPSITPFWTNASSITSFWTNSSSITIFGLISSSPIKNIETCQILNQFWHLLLDTIPTLLPCNDSFVNPSRRVDPTQKFVRRHQHDMTSAQVRTPADLSVSPLARYSRATIGSEDAAALGASCSSRSVFLHSSDCSSVAAPDPLLPTWMSLILFSSC